MPITHTETDENAFMTELLGDLDDTFWNAKPTPTSSPVKTKVISTNTTPDAGHKTHLHSPTTPRPRSSTPEPARQATYSAGEIDVSALLEGADDWNLDIDPFTPQKDSRIQPSALKQIAALKPYTQEDCTRCVVKEVKSLGASHSKELIVQVERSGEQREVILLDEWAISDVRVGDTMNVLGSFEQLTSASAHGLTFSITISSRQNYLILHPDLLLTATSLSNTAQCRRRPLLTSLVRSGSDTTPAMLWGNILHEVVQSCLQEGNWDQQGLQEKIDESIQNNIVDLVKNNVTIEQAKREVFARSRGINAFAERYLAKAPKSSAILQNTRSKSKEPSLLAITELLDVEEDIWSPTYGLKGKIDATVHGIISDPSPENPFTILRPENSTISGPFPLELKTGLATNAMEHRAQTMLYTLLLSERYGVDVSSGLLFYTQKEEVLRVPRGRNEIRGLINARNEMTTYMMRRMRGKKFGLDATIPDIEEAFLPPTINDQRICQRCYSLPTCMLYRKAIENVVDDSSPINEIYAHHTSHLTDQQCEFFKHWENLISLEEHDLNRFKKELWTMGAAERESQGRCFGSMVFDTFYQAPLQEHAVGSDARIHRFTYRFIRARGHGQSSLLHGHMSLGDAITLSVEPHFLALARGYIIGLTPTEVILGVDHEVSLTKIRTQLNRRASQTHDQVIFRIDKDELFAGMGRIRENLAQLFYVDGDTHRLGLIVDLARPQFSQDNALTRRLPDAKVARHLNHLNASQKLAVTKVLTAHDYALILGMPGTGKTTVIAAIIKVLVEMGKTVLLTSYTHSAVDTILAKLLDVDFGILRLGNMDKIHPDVRKFTLSVRRMATTVEQLEQQLMTPPVVATTCLSVDHGLFSRRRFDYCIVDEASQLTLPTCLGPIRYADAFILVGDHFQLPPLVRNPSARKGGFDISLFRRLSDAHPAAVIDLAYQYRMNEDIMLLSNKLIYGDRLRCGNDEVAKRSLLLPNVSFLADIHGENPTCHQGGCWVSRILSESCKAVFVDTDLIPALDSRVGDLVQNETEAQLVQQLVQALLHSGVKETQIGIISLYRQQVKLISHSLQLHPGIEILTADRSQGRDKDCIIFSMVRSNESGQIGDLLKDWRRINVSFTRAKSKLAIFGSQKTLQSLPLLEEFFALMKSRNWILQLPPGADAAHPCLASVQSSSSKRSIDDSQHSDNSTDEERPVKKIKARHLSGEKILQDKPILRDLINESC